MDLQFLIASVDRGFISQAEATKMVRAFLGLNDPNSDSTLPATGETPAGLSIRLTEQEPLETDL